MNQQTNHKWVWLSHVLKVDTPTYNNQSKITITPKNSMCMGHSSNTSLLSFSSHDGTHVDAPLHFIQNGNSIDSYSAEHWIFNHPLVLKAKCTPKKLIQSDDVSLPDYPTNKIDLILIQTDFETQRSEDAYWNDNPGLSESLVRWILKHFPLVRAIGVDLISVSNLSNRDEGRKVHKILLEKNILIIEDLSLKKINNNLVQVIALPLRYDTGDGSPCTIIGLVSTN